MLYAMRQGCIARATRAEGQANQEAEEKMITVTAIIEKVITVEAIIRKTISVLAMPTPETEVEPPIETVTVLTTEDLATALTVQDGATGLRIR